MMLVANVRSGQLSNRLVSTAYALAYAIDRKKGIWLTEFDDLKEHYHCKVSWEGKVRIRTSLFWQFERWLLYKVRKYLPQFTVPGVMTTWDFKNVDGAERHAGELREFFAPKDVEIRRARDFLSRVRTNVDIIVGVHIRRGDYQRWQGGRYFFSDEVYSRNMKNLMETLVPNGRIGFLVFSNEKVDLANFSVGTCVWKSEFNPIEDHWLMSQCDYLIGPPSTFTLWAAFMGGRRLGFITNAERCVKEENFLYRSLLVYC